MAACPRILLLIGCALACGLGGPAAGGWIEERDGQTIIHVTLDPLAFPDPTRTDIAIQANAAAVREFTRKFPELFREKYRARYQADPARYGRHNWDRVDVELHSFSGIRVEGVESDLLAIAGGVAPDVLYVNFRKSQTYIDQGFLYPLDRPGDGYWSALSKEEQAFRIHPKIWPVIRRPGRDGETRVWAMPFGGALGKVLFFRKDLFDEAGVAYPDASWTWEDLYQACRRLADPARGRYAIRFVRAKHESYHWMNFLWSAGGDVLRQNEATGAWEVVFDSPEAAAALDFYTRLCTEPWTDAHGRRRYGYAFKEPTEGSVKWDRGEIAMMFDYVDERIFSRINPDVTGMAPVPLGPTGRRGAELNSRMMGLFSEIKEPAVRDAAWEYIRFFDSPEAVRIKTRVMVEGGLGRFVNPRYLRQFGYEDLIHLAPPGWEQTFHLALDSGIPEPYGKHSNIAYDILTRPIHEAEELALAGRLPAGPAGREAALLDLLRRAAERARIQMLGEVPPDTLGRRRLTAAAALLATLAAFALGLRRIRRSFTPPAPAGAGGARWGFRKFAWAYLLIAPAALTILAWQYLPLGRGLLMAFQDYRLLGGSRWVGLDNLGEVLWNADWWRAVGVSFRYSLLVIGLTFIPPVILAILLQEIPRGRFLFRTIFYLPAVMTGLVVILLWKSFYDPSEAGLLNALIMKTPSGLFLGAGLLLAAASAALARRCAQHGTWGGALAFALAGVALAWAGWEIARPALEQGGGSWLGRLAAGRPEPFRWLGDPETALLACVLPMVWAGVGPGCLIYLAALKGVGDELYEAADLDGATFADKILFVVFPVLRPLLIINFVGVFIGSWFHATANILAMTGGAAGTEVAGLHIFYQAFLFLRFGPATAMAWMLGVMLIGFTVHQLKVLARVEFRAGGEREP
jgi:ABC-type sugar transport system permease subunit/ABC-type glycerol-3-phosphate transport system substrate-binding protein